VWFPKKQFSVLNVLQIVVEMPLIVLHGHLMFVLEEQLMFDGASLLTKIYCSKYVQQSKSTVHSKGTETQATVF
jgi:hypothetical protein